MRRASSPTSELPPTKTSRIVDMQQVCLAPLTGQEIAGYIEKRRPLIIGFIGKSPNEIQYDLYFRTGREAYGRSGWVNSIITGDIDGIPYTILDGGLDDFTEERISESSVSNTILEIQHKINSTTNYNRPPRIFYIPDLLNFKRILYHRLECRQLNPNFAIQQILAHLQQEYQHYQRYLQTGNLFDLIYIYTYLVSQIRVLNPELPLEIPSIDALFVNLGDIEMDPKLTGPSQSWIDNPDVTVERKQEFAASVNKMRTFTPILYDIVVRSIVTA